MKFIDQRCGRICANTATPMSNQRIDNGSLASHDYAVRCFRRTPPGKLRPGIWVMTRESGHHGLFIHGTRNEFQAPRYSVEELTRWSTEGGFLPVEEITPDDVLHELEDWAEAQIELRAVFERYRIIQD